MRGGFSFCGVDIADIGIEYAPEIEDTYVYKPATTNIHEETFDGHDGGYMYGAWREPKEFTLRCLFEEKRIDRGLLAKVYSLFRVGRSGKLIFQRRPWCYYYATVSEPIDDSEFLTYLSGTFVIKMKAYYPFARSDMFTCLKTNEHAYEIMENTAMFDHDGMIPETDFTNLDAETPVILANPGTEPAALNIKIAGDTGSGVVIENKTNGTSCGFTPMTRAGTTDIGAYVYVNGISGNTTLVKDLTKKTAFIYHSQGFITLEPAFPVLREIYVKTSGKTVTTTNRIFEDVVGQFIYIDGSWHKIQTQPNLNTLITYTTMPTWAGQTTIMRMNELTVRPLDSMYLSTLNFIYQPTFA